MTELQRFVIRTTAMLTLAVVLTIFLASFLLARRDNAIYPNNFYISGIKIGGLDREQAKAKIDQVLGAEQQELFLDINGVNIQVSLAEAGIEYRVEQALDKMDSILSDEDLWSHIAVRARQQDITAFNYDKDKLRQKLESLKKQYDFPVKNARVSWRALEIPEGEEYGVLDYTEEQKGLTMEVEPSVSLIELSLNKGDLGPVTLNCQVIEPRVTESFLKTADKLLAVEVMPFDKSSVNPGINTANKLNGIIILPQEQIPLQDVVGLAVGANPILGNNKIISQQLPIVINDLFRQREDLFDKDSKILSNHGDAPLVVVPAYDGEFLYWGLYGSGSEDREASLLVKRRILPAKIGYWNEDNLGQNQQHIYNNGKSGQITEVFHIIKVGAVETERVLLKQSILEPETMWVDFKANK